MKNETITQLSNSMPPPPPPPPPPQSPNAASGKRSKIGLIVTALGALITFIAAVIYLAVGNAAPGIVGVLFVIIIAFFLYRGLNTTELRAKQLAGLMPFFFGWIIMIVVGTAILAFDPVVLVGGLLLVVGGSALLAGK